MNLEIKSVIKIACLVSLISIASTCGMNKDITAYAPLTEHSVSQIEVVTSLASDDMEGREIGTDGSKKAAEYIASEMSKLALAPAGDNGTYFQDFSFKPVSISPHGSAENVGLGQSKVVEINGRNVIGFIDNLADNTIIIGAHYDHLGYGNDFSLFKGEKAIHNGADDNASGVAAMLQIASDISHTPEMYAKYNYMFIAFSGEEYGLIGSNHFCTEPTINLSEVSCMLNFDMVGRLNAESALAVYGNGTSPKWTDIVNKQNKNRFDIIFEESGVGPSDHTSFYFMDIPVLHFFTGQHEDYHKPSDDISKINFEGLAAVTSFVEDIVLALQGEEKLEFTKTKDSTTDEMSFNVTLGVVPDYMFSGEGMRIDGVTEERPAANAGMQKGDVVIQMDEIPVKDMMGYMECLGKFKEGDTTVVQVKRGEEILSLPVTWD